MLLAATLQVTLHRTDALCHCLYKRLHALAMLLLKYVLGHNAGFTAYLNMYVLHPICLPSSVPAALVNLNG